MKIEFTETKGIINIDGVPHQYRYTTSSAGGMTAVYAAITGDGYGPAIALKKPKLLKMMSADDANRILIPGI